MTPYCIIGIWIISAFITYNFFRWNFGKRFSLAKQESIHIAFIGILFGPLSFVFILAALIVDLVEYYEGD